MANRLDTDCDGLWRFMSEQELFKQAAEAVARSKALVFAAGAGMGVDSGLPDFRGTEGFWRAYPAIAKLGIEFEEMANPLWFQKAGFHSERVMECHGALEQLQCTKACNQTVWKAGPEEIEIDEESFRTRGPLPKCPYCGSLARPNVLMFGDGAWVQDRTAEQRARMMSWQKPISESNEPITVLEFGAGTAVPSVRHFSEAIAKLNGATLIRVNPRESSVPKGHIGIALGALAGIEGINSMLQ